MPRQPFSRERICEALESCRPGSHDLSSPAFADIADQVAANPELEERYERIQVVDQKISAAFHNVPIPLGLEQRLMASLELARAEDPVAPALEVETDADHIPPELSSAASATKKERRISRRWLVFTGGTLTAAAVLCFAVIWGMSNTAEYSNETVLTEASQFFATDNPGDGRLLAKVPPPSPFRLSKFVSPLSGTHWRIVKGFLGRDGIAFDLPARGGDRATLYVVPRTIAGLAASPSLTPSTNTGGCSLSTWQEGGLVYVLVVQGSQKSYQDYLNLPRGPIA